MTRKSLKGIQQANKYIKEKGTRKHDSWKANPTQTIPNKNLIRNTKERYCSNKG